MSALALTQHDVVEATIDLTPAEARALTDGIRRDLDAIAAALAQAYTGRAWIALGHDSWDTYIDVELGDALKGLVIAARRQVVGALADTGMSNYAIAAAVGAKSDQTVRGDLKVVRPQGRSALRVGADGKTYAAATSPALTGPRPMLALPGPRKVDTALDRLELAGPDGLTIIELQRAKQRWTYSQASACLSRLNAQTEQYDGGRRRRIERLAERRNGYAVYVLPEYVIDRETLNLGQRLPRT